MENTITWESLFDRRKYNRMNGDEQAAYIESLKKKAAIMNAKNAKSRNNA